MTDEPKRSRISEILESVREAMGADLPSSFESSGEFHETDLLADAVQHLLESVQKQRAGQELTQAALLDCKDKYRRLKANIPGMVYVFARHPDGSFSFPYVNEGSRQLFDIPPEDLMRDATLITRLIHPDDRERFEASVKRSAEMLLSNREIFRLIVHGEVRWYDFMSRPELQPNGDILYDGIILEVTGRMKAMESLRESEQKLSNIISSSPIGITIYDSSGQCIQANDSAARIIGATKQQVLEQNYHYIPSWKESGLLEMAVTAVRTKSSMRHEVVVNSTFGKKVLLDCHLVPFGADGLLLMAQDITEHKRTEETLRRTV
jgi:PAS domain S-box-containing protein